MQKKARVKDAYPMRINKYLAHKGYATRRAADELIERNKVLINGVVAKLGSKVMENDEVVVKNQGGSKKALLYFAYNKPRGEMTEDIVAPPGTFAVGRLDKDSYGLIILTNDGRITDRLLNPEYAHEKEYVVKTKERLREGFAARMSKGVDIEGYQTKPSVVKALSDYTFSITLTEGKRHQIRRMVVAMKNEVEDLKRTRIMNVALGKLAPGTSRAIEGEELETFLKSLGL